MVRAHSRCAIGLTRIWLPASSLIPASACRLPQCPLARAATSRVWIASLCQAWGQLQEASCQPYLPISMATLSSTEPCPCIPPLAAGNGLHAPGSVRSCWRGRRGWGQKGQGPSWTPYSSGSQGRGRKGPSAGKSQRCLYLVNRYPEGAG